MFFSRNRPITTYVVLAGYLLAITMSGLLHDHGSHEAACCEHGGCAEAADKQHASSAGESGQVCRHDHAARPEKCSRGHSHSGCSHKPVHCHHKHRHGETQSHRIAKTASRSQSASVRAVPQHVSCDGCLVCQFLATASLAGPAAAEVLSGECLLQSVRYTSHVFAGISSQAHQARGPPAAA